MLLLWIGTALAAPCPELASVVDGGWDAFYDAEIDAAKEASATAHQALECLEQVAPIDALLDLYRLDALIALSEGDQRSAVYATIRAVTVSPDTSPPADLGPELSDLHETWADRLAGSRARVRVEGGGTLWVDGRAATASAPLTVVEGEHLVQLDGPEGWTSGIRDISSDLVIETGLPTSEPTAASVPSEPAAASVPTEPAAAVAG